MPRFNLELLSIFDEIYETKSITRAAENLGVAQPTVSIALSKLRQHFGDQLFTRTTKGMEPTPFAQQIIGEVQHIVHAAHSVLTRQAVFNPSESKRDFRIAMSDVSEIIMLPVILNRLRQLAPGVGLDIVKVSTHTPTLLRDGEIDLAIGFLPHLYAGFYQQTLLEQSFVCIAAAAHPRIQGRLTIEQFEREQHVLVKNSTTGRSIVDRIMVTNGLQRKVALRLPGYLGAAHVVSRTECIATVPERLGRIMTGQEAIRCFPVPLELPPFHLKQHWHERFHLDPGNLWLRKIVADDFITSHAQLFSHAVLPPADDSAEGQ